jgi:dTDP-4-dehydrorhamnose 3,5-epimerase-like enzyme
MSYRQLDSGTQVQNFIPMVVREGRIDEGGEPPRLVVEREVGHPTVPGVEVSQAPTFINERRVLVVSYNSAEPPGTLGYTVVVRPGHAVGDHFHHRRDERILVLHGRAEFRILDQRPGTPGFGRVNCFTLDYPGVSVHIPTGVAHAIVADGTLTVLQVLASADYMSSSPRCRKWTPGSGITAPGRRSRGPCPGCPAGC